MFEVKAYYTYEYSRVKLSDIYKTVLKRDASKPNLISAQCYDEGIKRIENTLRENENAAFLRTFAVMKLIVKR